MEVLIMDNIKRLLNSKTMIFSIGLVLLFIALFANLEVVQPLLLLFVIYSTVKFGKKGVLFSTVFSIIVLAVQDIYNLNINPLEFIIEALIIIIAAFYIIHSTTKMQKLNFELRERVKELTGLYRISEAAEENELNISQTLNKIVNKIPLSYQYPADCEARIIYHDEEYKTDNFEESRWMQQEDLKIDGQIVGSIEISYLSEHPVKYNETVFLKEEFDLLKSIAAKISIILKNLEQAETIKEQKQFLSITLNSIGDGLIVTDKKGRIQKLNTIAENLTGWSIEEAYNKDIEEIFKIFNARTGEKAKNPVEKVLKEGKVVGLANHTKLIARDGNEYHIADSAAPIKTESGNIQGTVMVFRDVTRRRETEAELKKLNEIYRTLSMVNQLIVREKSLKKLLDEAVQIIADYGKYQNIWIGRIDNNLERIRVLSFSEPNTKNFKQNETYNIDLNNSVINFKEELISKDDDKLIVNDLPKTEEINSFLDSSCGSRAFFCLGAFDKPWGVLSFCSAEENNFDQTEVKLLDELTGDISLGIEKIINEKRRKDSEKRLKKSEKKYRRLFENSPVGIFKTTSRGEVKMINPHMAEILGFDSISETVNYYNDLKKELYVNSERRDQFIRLMQENREVNNFTYQAYDKNKNIMWLEMDARVSKEYDDGTFVIDGFCWDITERKKNQEKIQYIGFHDKLTNLYNRAFLEEEIKRIDTKRQLPISIIMGDLNNLKLINDTYGHQKGDKLIRKAARLFEKSCREEDIIARWGGDEFVVLLPQTSVKESEEIIKRINQEISKEEGELAVSIALGNAAKVDIEEDLMMVLSKAEDRMYKNKISSRKSARSSVLSAFLTSLKEKSSETEEHVSRMSQIANDFADEIGLSNSEKDRLHLLTQMHDIGKIAVPEEILNKPNRLSEKEWELMKKHTETGFRITSNLEDFAHISYEILHHHEHWNGCGYPDGLAGEKIPMLSRMLSIIDAYDVMISGRPYQDSMTEEEALKELQRCAGTQFDPELVDKFIQIISTNINKGDLIERQ